VSGYPQPAQRGWGDDALSQAARFGNLYKKLAFL
jgi:hypothetical protein